MSKGVSINQFSMHRSSTSMFHLFQAGRKTTANRDISHGGVCNALHIDTLYRTMSHS